MLALAVESWIWYGFVMTIVFLRFVSRALHFGSLRRFQVEDYVMLLVAVFYTILIVCLNEVELTNLVPPDQLHTITAASIPARIQGSKLVVVVEQSWCAAIWGCKICLLLLYQTITVASRQRRLVLAVGSYVLLGYVIMEILFFAVWCRPFPEYWSVPTDNEQCSTYHNHLILNTVLNLSSDILMLFIPLPIIIRAKLPIRKKLILTCVFSVGLFTIICAALSKYYSFRLPYGAEWVFWYVREVSTAVIVANVPHCWVLVRKCLNVRDFLSNSTNRANAGFYVAYGHSSGRKRSQSSKNHTGNSTKREHPDEDKHWFEMVQTRATATHDTDAESLAASRTDSEARINAPLPLQIMKNVDWKVETEQVSSFT